MKLPFEPNLDFQLQAVEAVRGNVTIDWTLREKVRGRR